MMKTPALLLLLLSLLPVASEAAPIKKFVKTSLLSRMYGPGDWASPFMRDRCDEADQAQARKSAEDNAKMDCEMAEGVNDCLVKNSRIIFNSAQGNRIPPEILAKYGLEERDLFGYWGCEAEALVYGLTE